MAITFPYLSFYIVNPNNTRPVGPENLYFNKEIGANYSVFVQWLIIMMSLIIFNALYFFKNPPHMRSKVSEWASVTSQYNSAKMNEVLSQSKLKEVLEFLPNAKSLKIFFKKI